MGTFKTLIVKDYDTETFDWTSKVSDDEIAFIISETDKTVYAWYGQRASNMKKYKGGTLATKIKSLYQFYGFKTATVNQGEETGGLKEEIGKLLQGAGTSLSEKERESLKPVAAEACAPAVPMPRPAPAADVRPGAVARVEPAPAVTSKATSRPAPAREVAAVPDAGAASRVAELEEELETERKKAAHKVSRLKEEVDELRASHETEMAAMKKEQDALQQVIDGLKRDLDAASSAQVTAKDVSRLEAELDSLKSSHAAEISDLKKDHAAEIERLAGASAGGDDAKQLAGEIEELKAVQDRLREKNDELKGTVSSLQAEIASLKEKLEAPAATPVDSGAVKDLEASLASERKASEEKIAAKEASIKRLEGSVADLQAKLDAANRKVLEAPAAPVKEDGLDFASLDTIDDAAGGPSLTFVNPYSAGDVGAKVDPLNDLKSFLNTVDPSKPLDPALKSLLSDISTRLEQDDEAVETLEAIKKQVKDKALAGMVDDVIHKILAKRA